MASIIQRRQANLQDNSINTSLTWGEIVVTLARNFLLIYTEPLFNPSFPTAFATQPGFKPTTNSVTTGKEIWENMIQARGGMHTAWDTKTNCTAAEFCNTDASSDTSSSLVEATTWGHQQ